MLQEFGELTIVLWVQALAAIGQGRLIAMWDDLFGHLEQPIAQVLLTRGDISDVCLGVLSGHDYHSHFIGSAPGI